MSTPYLGLVAVALAPLLLVGGAVWTYEPENWVPRSQGSVYAEHPPLAHTGGFGEPTCQACHFGGTEDELDGSLTVEGMPVPVQSGRTYELTIALRAEMTRSGFMLAVRDADGTQAGRLSVGDTARVAVHAVDSTNVQYAHHTLSGTEVREPNRAVWRVQWTAPDLPSDSVFLHVSANAANDDASEFGDDVYTEALRMSVEN